MKRNKPYKIGLALSGGGARGFAHLGVILAMQKFGKLYKDLDEAESKVITKAIPMKISEAEPRKTR